MRQLSLELKSSSKPTYLRIAAALRNAIKTAQLKPGEQLPSARILAEQLGVNRHTVMSALTELIAEGWLISHQRKGYFVVSELPVDGSVEGKVSSSTAEPVSWRLVRQVTAPSRSVAAACEYNFSGGCPDISLFGFKSFSGYLADAMARPDHRALNYGYQQGFEPFLQQLSVYLRRVRSLTGKKIIAVNGSQEALFLISQVLLAPGDKVAVEQLGYQPAWLAFRSAGASLVGIRQDDDGIDPEHLEQMAKQHHLRLIYLTPLHQYPTTVTLPVARRMQIYRIAADYHIPIVEDDYDHEFHYRCQPLAPMAADDPAGLVIYLSTFSKIMFPGVRIGFVAAPDELADALVNYRVIANHKPNVVLQDAIARWMVDGAFERHLRKLTRTYEQRRNFMVAQLQSYRRLGIDLSFRIPDGGMAMWIKTAMDVRQLTGRALTRGVYLQSENDFHLNADNSENRYIRLGFAGMDEQRMAQGLERIFVG